MGAVGPSACTRGRTLRCGGKACLRYHPRPPHVAIKEGGGGPQLISPSSSSPCSPLSSSLPPLSSPQRTSSQTISSYILIPHMDTPTRQPWQGTLPKEMDFTALDPYLILPTSSTLCTRVWLMPATREASHTQENSRLILRSTVLPTDRVPEGEARLQGGAGLHGSRPEERPEEKLLVRVESQSGRGDQPCSRSS